MLWCLVVSEHPLWNVFEDGRELLKAVSVVSAMEFRGECISARKIHISAELAALHYKEILAASLSIVQENGNVAFDSFFSLVSFPRRNTSEYNLVEYHVISEANELHNLRGQPLFPQT